MPDCIVRFGGNNLKDIRVISTLAALLKKSGKRHLLVVSATKEIQGILVNGIQTLCAATCEPGIVFSEMNEEIRKIATLHHLKETKYVYPFVEKLEILLRGIHFTGDFSLALQDQVISYGEKITTALLCNILQKYGIPAGIHLPEDIGLTVSEEYGNASILPEASEKIARFPFDLVSLIPGSFGITSRGKIARLGDQAADYTAAALAALFNAERLELWQIGKPFKTADDQYVPDTAYIDSLTYAEASELSYFNYSGIHPRIVEPLISKHIPAYVYDLTDGEKILRTKINSQNIVTPQVVKSVAHTDEIAVLRLNGPGVGFKPGILAKVTTAFSSRHINIRSVITAQTNINIMIDKRSVPQVRQICSELKFNSVSGIDIAEHVSLIAVVGHGMQSHHGISAQLFAAVAKSKINVVISGSGASDLVSYLVVDEADKIKAIQEIHRTFFHIKKV
ncbi:MAG: aspartate kinase [Mangrovibacterium sp.]|nr:aspartate kinase [Mangrovibacterium sp.]